MGKKKLQLLVRDGFVNQEERDLAPRQWMARVPDPGDDACDGEGETQKRPRLGKRHAEDVPDGRLAVAVDLASEQVVLDVAPRAQYPLAVAPAIDPAPKRKTKASPAAVTTNLRHGTRAMKTSQASSPAIMKPI